MRMRNGKTAQKGQDRLMKSATKLPRRGSIHALLVVAALAFCSRAGGAQGLVPDARPSEPLESLCSLLERIEVGQKLEVTVSGLYRFWSEFQGLYEVTHHQCDLDVQPFSSVEFAKGLRLDPALDSLLEKEREAFVTVRGVLWGPPPIPPDDPSQPPLIAAMNRVASGARRYAHLGNSRTKLVVEEILFWRPITPSDLAQRGTPKPRPVSPIPVVRSASLPEYPRHALFGGLSGEVVVEVTVKSGRVVEAKVKSGDRMLYESVVENVKTWRFDDNVDTTFTTTFSFLLELRKLGSDRNARLELHLPLSARIIGPLNAW